MFSNHPHPSSRVGKALASPHRLELLAVLAQGERSVEVLAQETGMPIVGVPTACLPAKLSPSYESMGILHADWPRVYLSGAHLAYIILAIILR
jgi:DNA-binding transcriptional ArsR family regulator